MFAGVEVVNKLFDEDVIDGELVAVRKPVFADGAAAGAAREVVALERAAGLTSVLPLGASVLSADCD